MACEASTLARLPAPDGACLLCSGPLPAAQAEGYCCEGCRRVAEILQASGNRGDPRTSAAFLEAARLGLVPAGPPGAPSVPAATAGSATRRLALSVDGLWCPSCAWLVEEVVGRAPGVHSVRVTFFADLAEIAYDPAVTYPDELAGRVEALGYRVKREGQRADRGPLLRFGLAAFLQMNVMWLSYALYAHRAEQALGPVATVLPWVLAALSAPVVFWAGWPMLHRAWRAARERALVMDSLIALGAVSAWVYSIVAAARGSGLVYFDGAGGLVTFRLLGRLLEQAAFRRAALAGDSVRRLLPRKARRVTGAGVAWSPADALRPGERIRVAPGERVPLDGRVVAGTGRVSTAVVDGEPFPRAVRPGDAVPGGSVCGESALDLVVTSPAQESLLSRVADHVAHATGRRGPAPEVSDALARLFVPGVLALSVITFAAWIGVGLEPAAAFLRGLSVLVVSCPCALGLAAPLARVVAAGALARRGVIARGEGALDLVAAARRIAFDKTGTLTLGRLTLSAVEAEGWSPRQATAALGGLEERSGHPVAEAVRAAGVAAADAGDLRAVPGCGVAGTLDGEPAWAGRPDWVEGCAGAPPAAVGGAVAREQALGRTAILLAGGRGRWAAFSFGDELRPEAAGTLAWLRAHGLETVVLSGDAAEAVAAVARSVGAEEAHGGCLPEEKARLLEADQTRHGRRTVFVGDGINDAPGLAAAVGVAVAGGTDFARETADVLLLEAGLSPIPELVASARRMRRVIRQNLAWAALYNAVLVPLAAAGLLTPVWAAAAMVASGLLVVLNALRLQRPAGAPTGAR
jgi:Cu2+-exporting ATPase